MGLPWLLWHLVTCFCCAVAADLRQKSRIRYDGTGELEVLHGARSVVGAATSAAVHLERNSMMRQERSTKLVRSSDALVDESLASRVPRERASAFRNVLCRGPDVRVLVRSNNYRIIQFRNDNGEWLMEEGKMRCNEDISSCEKREDSPSVAECPSCACSAALPIEEFWSPYQSPMLAKIQRHCSGSKEYNMIVVGLGTSSGLQGVAQHCKLGRLAVVEKQQDVFDAATKFFGLNASRISTHSQVLVPYDGAQGLKKLVLEHGQHTYDAVLVDCMNQGRIPEGCRSPDFYKALSQSLKPGGLVFQWSWDQDQREVQRELASGLGAPVEIFQQWATAHETGIPASLTMLSGSARGIRIQSVLAPTW